MSQETLIKIYSTIEKYINQKKSHPEFIDFYSLYDIDPNKKATELKSDLKRIRRLFHPDQKQYIDEKFYEIYDEILKSNEQLIDMENDDNKKRKYDNDLANMKSKSNHSENNYNNQNTNRNNDSEYARDEKYIQHMQAIQSTIETMIMKYGFSHAYSGITNALRGDFSGITRDNNCRKKLSSIGLNEILKTIKVVNPYGNYVDNTMDLFLNVMERTIIKDRADDFYEMCNKIQSDGINGYSNLYNLIYSKINNNEETSNEFLDRDYENRKNTGKTFSSKDITFLMYARIHKEKEKNPELAFSRFSSRAEHSRDKTSFIIDTFSAVTAPPLQNTKGFGY